MSKVVAWKLSLHTDYVPSVYAKTNANNINSLKKFELIQKILYILSDFRSLGEWPHSRHVRFFSKLKTRRFQKKIKQSAVVFEPKGCF